VIVDGGRLYAERGRGAFIARGQPGPLAEQRPVGPRAAFLRKIFPETPAA